MAQKLLLLADDEVLIQRLFQAHLQRVGYETIIAENGRRAIELAAAEHPDLIILDVLMPEVNGLEALRLLKAAKMTESIPVLVITSQHDKLTRQEALNCGALGFLTKPFGPVQLVTEVERILNSKTGAPSFPHN